VMELNIGHFLIGESIFRGLQPAIAEMRRLMDEARETRSYMLCICRCLLTRIARNLLISCPT
jgi:hypothetical protein